MFYFRMHDIIYIMNDQKHKRTKKKKTLLNKIAWTEWVIFKMYTL